jgi:hypothetical protein
MNWICPVCGGNLGTVRHPDDKHVVWCSQCNLVKTEPVYADLRVTAFSDFHERYNDPNRGALDSDQPHPANAVERG